MPAMMTALTPNAIAVPIRPLAMNPNVAPKSASAAIPNATAMKVMVA